MAKTVNREKDLSRIDEVLERHDLKKTPLRRSILLAFAEAKISLSQADLIEAISKGKEQADRVSIYRNLVHLKDAGVVHEVDANNYVFCSHECKSHGHLLLFCQKCHRYQEVINHDKIHAVTAVLDGFKFFAKDDPIFLRGVCVQCASKE